MVNMLCLVPRPFPPPVFDHSQYTKREGEAGIKYHMSDINVHQVDRRGRGLNARMCLVAGEQQVIPMLPC